jgi:sugar lactone lactonase YvrE
VVGASGDNLYVFTPRQPGDESVISVVVGNDSVPFHDSKFTYQIRYIIRTIAGRKGTTEFKGGKLSEAEFQYPSTITADANGNLFVSHWRVPYCLLRINEEKDIVEAVLPGSNSTYYALGAPTVDSDGVVSAIQDDGGIFFTLDPLEDWAPRTRSIITPTDPALRYLSSTAHSLAAHPVTGELYTRYFTSGHLIKVDPYTRVGSLVSETYASSDSYLVFDPVETDILYIAYHHLHCIARYNVATKEHTIFAGRNGTPDWIDGPAAGARFKTPNQVIVAPDGSLYVADRGNHCIRRITFDENRENPMVTTVIGKGGIPGYQDGNPDDALFNEPRGVAVLPNGDIYITDYENNVIRKLTIE